MNPVKIVGYLYDGQVCCDGCRPYETIDDPDERPVFADEAEDTTLYCAGCDSVYDRSLGIWTFLWLDHRA